MPIAWVFPGQGSQKLGMADKLMTLPGANERFSKISDLLGRDLLAICRGEAGINDKPVDLNDTLNTQPALFVIESLLVDDLIRQGREANIVAGHSLGELVALYSAGVFDLDTGLNLIKRRSELMASAGNGAMIALIGFNRSKLEKLINTTEGVSIANDNSDSQVVISGDPQAVKAVSTELKCKRAIPLAVSGAFHSSFMRNAASQFSEILNSIKFNDARIPVLSNSDPFASRDAYVLKQRLIQQMTKGVRWRETMQVMASIGIDTVVEIGPGNVLSGLAKRSITGVTTAQISGSGDLGE